MAPADDRPLAASCGKQRRDGCDRRGFAVSRNHRDDCLGLCLAGNNGPSLRGINHSRYSAASRSAGVSPAGCVPSIIDVTMSGTGRGRQIC